MGERFKAYPAVVGNAAGEGIILQAVEYIINFVFKYHPAWGVTPS